jgi:hypothetical protein
MEDNFKAGNAAGSYPPSAEINTKQVSQLLQIQIRTAQDLLKNTRKALGKLKNASVSVKEFCFVNNLSEEEVLEALLYNSPDIK